MEMLVHFIILFLGWLLFIGAFINIVRLAYDFATQRMGSIGVWAVVRAALCAVALSGWFYLVFVLYPLALAVSLL